MPDCDKEPDLCSEFTFEKYDFSIDLYFNLVISMVFNRPILPTFINLKEDFKLKIIL
jgi:hypothetical protein